MAMWTRSGRSSSAPTTTSQSRSRCPSSRPGGTPSCAGRGAGCDARECAVLTLTPREEPGNIGLIAGRRHLEARALAEFGHSLVMAAWPLDVVVPDAESVYGI